MSTASLLGKLACKCMNLCSIFALNGEDLFARFHGWGFSTSLYSVGVLEEDREPRSDVDVPLEGHVPVGSVDVDSVPVPAVDMLAQQMPRRVFLEALRLLDEVDLALIFRRRVVVMKSVPKFMQGVFRVAVRAALEEVTAARLVRDDRRHTRAWKLFLLLPRLLLFRPPRGGLIPRKRLEERCALFARGDWTVLLAASECSVRSRCSGFRDVGVGEAKMGT